MEQTRKENCSFWENLEYTIMTKVSVIIPVYNVEKYLKECLDSIINQTLKDIEIICVDDGSTDNSLAILEELAKKDDRFIILKQENKGAGIARNKGLEVAKGEYLSFLDSDDFFELNMLEELYNIAKNKNSDIAICNFDYYNNKTKEFIKNKENVIPQNLNEKDFDKELLNWFKEFAHNKLFKKDFIFQNNLKFQEIKRANDLFFSKASICLTDKISTIDKPFVHYRVALETNLSSTNSKTPLEFTKALIKLKEFLIENDLYKKYEKSFISYSEGLIEYTLRTLKIYPKKYWELKKYIFNSIVPELNLNKKNIGCWSDFKILSSYIFSVRKTRFSSKYLLTILGKQFCLR